MNVDHRILNDALNAYVWTFPTKGRLDEHIRAAGLSEQRDAIVAELDALIQTAEQHLFNYPGGVPWTKAFEDAYRQLLLGQHPWMNEESLGRILGFSHWICWHEGLNRSP